ncbi:hypothetical protein [Methanoculleus sp. 7T]|nr:hypothetical protein [Methanoculleus sp. 7T]
MDASMSLNDPRLQEAIARIHKEQPEEWRGLVQKSTASTKA